MPGDASRLGCIGRFLTIPLVFWSFTYGALLWKLVDYGSDIAYVITEVYGSAFDGYSDKYPAVRTVAVILLVIDGLLLILIEIYVIRVKRRIAKHGLLEDPSYLYRISWVEFIALLLMFLFEDGPQLIVFGIVQNETEGFGIIPSIQIATSLAASIYFFLQALRNYCLYHRAHNEQEATTQKRRGLWRKAAKAPIDDFKNRDYKAKNTREAVTTAVKEPKRAKKAKLEHEQKVAHIDGAMDAGIANAIVQPPKRRNSRI